MQTSAGHCWPSVFTVCRSCADGGGINVGQVGGEGGKSAIQGRLDQGRRDRRLQKACDGLWPALFSV